MILPGVIAGAAFGFSSTPGGVIVTEDPYYVNTAMQVDATGKADGTGYVTDDSRLANQIVYAGDAQITSGKFVFDGTGDYVRFPGRAVWAPGWHGFTVELWGVEFNSTASNQMLIAYYLADSGNDSRSFYINHTGSVLQLQGNPNGSSGSQTAIVSYAWVPETDGTEYDIAATWDGATACIYIDGVKVAEAAYTGGFKSPPATNTHLVLGASQQDSGYTNYFNGKIRAARYTKKIDRAGGVSSWGTRHLLPLPVIWDDTGFADPHWDKVVLLIRADSSGTKVFDDGPWDFKNTTIHGNTFGSSATVPYAGANSLNFDGSGDDVTYQHDPLFTLTSEDYTIELAARHTDISGGSNNDRSYIGKYDASTGNREWIFWFWANNSPDVVRFASPNAGPTVPSAAFTPTLGTWYHVATTREGNDRKIFIDGAQSGSTVSSATNLVSSNQPLYIGSLDGVSNYMEGSIAELRFTKGVNRYSSGFTKPAALLPRQ